MKSFDWDPVKNAALQAEREISFEDIVRAIDEGGLLDDIKHLNEKKYPNQRKLVVNVDNYVYIVPFIEEETRYFLKTIFPSRKMTKHYLFKRRKS